MGGKSVKSDTEKKYKKKQEGSFNGYGGSDSVIASEKCRHSLNPRELPGVPQGIFLLLSEVFFMNVLYIISFQRTYSQALTDHV